MARRIHWLRGDVLTWVPAPASYDLVSARGLTLEVVAARASIDVSTLSRLESGKRRLALDHLPGLAEALGVSADEP